VIGHGVEVDRRFFCCAHCACEATSTERIHDRADSGGADVGSRERRRK
jgi:hypothetical protein